MDFPKHYRLIGFIEVQGSLVIGSDGVPEEEEEEVSEKENRPTVDLVVGSILKYGCFEDASDLAMWSDDELMIGFSQSLKERDFIIESEIVSRKRKGKRKYLNDTGTRFMMRQLERLFESKGETPLIRQCKNQRIEIPINEEALLLAKYLRNERKILVPRIVCVCLQ